MNVEPWKDKIAILVREFGKIPQVDCPLKHYFAPGVYIREIFMPTGSIVIGKIHKTEHFNIIQQGKVSLIDDKLERHMLEAPITFVSKPGVQKVLYIHENTIWSTVHLTCERNLEALEAALIEPHDSYPLLNRSLEKLQIEAATSEERQ
jgi:hypothetical protein